ncbi:C2 domain-containing protein [Ilyonectria robusta]|uniref:C2 domain-containing protein n=1 Tax=Ilyonectria robusta TaxID=1079257 RepID=UPI001E8E22A6|nr:C2 domain-containing protein [Ilyonectria robusta]KAH8737653.1 C2 domain-containing protein [Ilyonectria robusta]
MSTAKEASELKQQGVLEAAADPQSSVTADDAQKAIVEASKNAGVAAFTFDPDATPEQKRAQARAAIPRELQNSRRPKGAAIITDVDDGTGPVEDLPEPSKDGVLDVARDEDGKPLADGEDPASGEPPYSRTGWAPRLGWPTDEMLEQESLLDHATWVEGQLPDHLYGDWYHNTGIIIFACISSWVVAVFGGGLAWVFLVMAICSTYYRTSLRRVRRNFRDDIAREMSLKKLENDNESLEWINSFMVKFWPIYQPVLAQTIINSVDQVLSSATPAFLDSLKLKTFTLGTKPPRMEHVKTYPKTEDDIVMMDWKFSFTPTDTADMTARQVKNKINPKIVLEIRIGKAMISKGLDVIVEDMAFSGIMRLKIKLQIPFPHIDRVEMCFLERPTIDYVCKPLGGDNFGFDINFIPGLETFILEQIHGNLAPMMYAPNVFPIEVAKMLAGSPVDQAVGVLAVTLHGAQGLKNSDNFGGTVDPYASLSLNRRQELARTKTIHDNANPRWNETHYIIITSFNDSLDMQVFDHNDFRKSKELGVASFQLESIEDLNVYENERIEVIADGKARGVISCDLRFFPVLAATTNEDGKEEPAPESNQGILRFTVEQAKDLDGTKSLVGQLNPYAVMFLNGKEIHQTKKLKRTNNPIWDNGSKEILITDRKKAKLGLTVKDERDLTGDQVLGKYQIKLDEMLECMAQGKEWYNLAGAHTGRVKMMAQWKPVAISGIASTGGYVTPIGVMRFHFKKATDLRNFEAFGKSDPYTRVLLSGIEKARTVTFRNDLNPEWDEVLYVPIHSARDRLTLEVMDTEKVGKDRSLGSVEAFAGDYVVQDENGEYLANDVKKLREDGLRIHGKGIAKGVLTYNVSFYPCLNVADPEEEEEEEKEKEKQEEEAAAKNDTSSSSSSSSDEEAAKPEPRSLDAGKFNANLDKTKDLEPLTPTTTGRLSTTERPSTDGRKGPPKIRLSPEELLKYETGLLIFRLMEAEMPESGTLLEVFVDDMAYPSYVSSTARTKSHKFEEIGDCLIRELDVSRLTLKCRKKGDDGDDILAQLTGNTLETLKQCLNNPTTLKLKGEDGRPASVKVSLKYIPVKMQLDPSESMNNMGQLRVDILDAADLPAADRNGKSDPYCKFELNGQEIHKTKVQKKTLNPTWNEFFEVPVPSRTGANFKVTVYDYDFADKPDLLGEADINLESLDPFRPSETKYILDGKSGSVRIRLLFRPDYVTRTRQGTSTFGGTFSSAPGRIVTGVAGAPLKGGVAVAGVVGHGVGKGASFVRRGLFRKKDTNDILEEESEVVEPPAPVPVPVPAPAPVANGGLRRTPIITTEDMDFPLGRPSTSNGHNGHTRSKSIGQSSVHSTLPGGAPGGTAHFTVVSATGFPPASDLYIIITQISPKEKSVGKTKHYKSGTGQWGFDETFKFHCSPDAQFKVEAKGEHLFGSDDELGEHVYFVDESGDGSAKNLAVGSGTVTIKSNFQPAEPTLTPDSPKAHLRRSFLSKREGRSSRETTPNP